MEKKLVKGALYGFVIGLFLAVLYYPEKRTVPLGPGSGFETYEVPLKRVALSFAVTFMLIMVTLFLIGLIFRS